jgi:lipoprotein
MKKNIKLTALLTLLVISLTGCVKFNSTMEIKKDKSMDYKIIYAFDKSLFGDQEILTSNDKKELENKGFTVSNYVDGNMKGFKVSKNIKNIDDVSSTNNATYDLSGLLDSNKSESKVFKVKKGFLKNTYTASFKFDSSDSDLNNSTSNDTTIDNDFTTDDNGTTTDSDFDFSNINTNMDLSFNVKLPYKAISSNATTKKNDDKELSWNLSSTGEDKIEFSFVLYNMTNIYICGGVIVLLIIIVIVSILNKSRKNKVSNKDATNDKQTTTFNSSVETPIMSNNVTSQSSENINKVEVFYQQPDKKSNIADMYSNQSIQGQASTNSQSTVFSTTNVNNTSVNETLSTSSVDNQTFPQPVQTKDIFSTTNVDNNLANQTLSTDTVNNQQSNVNNDNQIDTL